MPSIKDVARDAGVSTATVSRVLSDKPHVRKEVRERVMESVERLNYRLNRVAQSLRSQRSSIIGLIVADIQNPFFTSVSRAVEDVAYERGISVFLCNTDENPDKEALYLQLMHDQNAAGVIFSPTGKTADAFAETVHLNIPMVVIDRQVRDVKVDSVLIDNHEASYEIVSHLLADGHRRIGALFGVGSTTGRERRESYIRALKDHGIKPLPELSLFVPAKEADGYRGSNKLLDLAEPPDALFTSNGLLSAGALKAIRERNLRVPADIAFASFDETPWTPLVEPGVTVYEQPTYEIGQTAMELLFKRMEAPTRPTREVILNGRLLVRGSCGCNQLGASGTINNAV